MKTQAVRLYGKNDLRLEKFELPDMKPEEILAEVVTDSICMSTHKATLQGSDHKRVPEDISAHPVIIGHEFCGEIIAVGDEWKDQYQPGQRFVVQPALNYKGSLDAPGYSFRHIGGDATRILIPKEVMEMGCLLDYTGDTFFYGSLVEPMSCIVGALRASYHVPQGTYNHIMGIRPGGTLAVLAGAGPMGLGLIDILLHGERRPAVCIVADIDDSRLRRAASLYPPEDAAGYGVKLRYVNTKNFHNPVEALQRLSPEGGFDDVFVMAPVTEVVELADRLLAKDGCMNFFAGPTRDDFSARINFYDMHYAFHHIVGTSGGNTEDMKISIRLMAEDRIHPSAMITHIGGLDAVIDTTKNLPGIPGGKKLIYTHIRLPLTALEDLEKLGEHDPFFADLAAITNNNNGLWCKDAEDYLLSHAPGIDTGGSNE